MLDHIGTNLVSVRKQSGSGVTITRLAGDGPGSELALTSAEWFELIGLVLAIRKATDFWETYEPRA